MSVSAPTAFTTTFTASANRASTPPIAWNTGFSRLSLSSTGSNACNRLPASSMIVPKRSTSPVSAANSANCIARSPTICITCSRAGAKAAATLLFAASIFASNIPSESLREASFCMSSSFTTGAAEATCSIALPYFSSMGITASSPVVPSSFEAIAFLSVTSDICARALYTSVKSCACDFIVPSVFVTDTPRRSNISAASPEPLAASCAFSARAERSPLA